MIEGILQGKNKVVNYRKCTLAPGSRCSRKQNQSLRCRLDAQACMSKCISRVCRFLNNVTKSGACALNKMEPLSQQRSCLFRDV
jgi:hypothetical protein